MTKIYISLVFGILSFLASLLISHIIAKKAAKEAVEAHRPELMRTNKGRSSAKSGPSNGSDA